MDGRKASEGNELNLQNLRAWFTEDPSKTLNGNDIANYLEAAHLHLIHYHENGNREMYEWWRKVIEGMVKALYEVGVIDANEMQLLIYVLIEIDEKQRPTGEQDAEKNQIPLKARKENSMRRIMDELLPTPNSIVYGSIQQKPNSHDQKLEVIQQMQSE